MEHFHEMGVRDRKIRLFNLKKKLAQSFRFLLL